MPVIANPHVYQRSLQPEDQDSLAKLARLVRPGSSVLDLGAGPGVLGRYLAQILSCTVDGVEYNSAALAQAAPWYRRLECADLEQINLAEYFGAYRYEFIICADILEHLRRPADLLKQLSGLLTQDGQVLISIPNAAYAGLIIELLAGEFRYRPEGLLDQTHLRFFTLRSFLRLLEEVGLRAVAVDAAICEFDQSEFKEHYLDALPPALVRAVLGRNEALVYQFIVSAQIARPDDKVVFSPPVFQAPRPELRFACQLFWKLAEVGYQASESSATWGRMGTEHQCLSFPIPALSTPVQALRFDCADRPGLMGLHGLALRDQTGQLLWRWDGCWNSLAPQPSCQLAIASTSWSANGVLLLLTGEDPQLELPIPETALVALSAGGEFSVECSWPMSLDYLVLVHHCLPRRDAEVAQTALMRQIETLEASNAALTARSSELVAAAMTSTARNQQLESALAEQAILKSELERQLTVSASQISQQATRISEQAAEIVGLRRSWRERAWTALRRRWQN